MDTDKLAQFENRLLAEKENMERDLKLFATEQKPGTGAWQVKKPDFGSDAGDDEERIDEAEEYETEISLEHQFAERLRNIKAALEKMAKGTYGVCEKCGKEIEVERLKVNPEAQTHTSCGK
ncbi:TraR/DksA C4-type zinc finger protein [Candidatus Azambacteria bacterium]|nr:TraR/DksA C4-type zinc finger protein [Candidatus Azambacteria bacterium]MBI3685678.1 TraR/DksA C4-type zinc finger protein [Candidatus Azambacteria bacterium]